MSSSEDLICKICLDDFDGETKKARNLRCGNENHSFCTSCLEKLLSFSVTSSIVCPKCRVETSGIGSINDLPENMDIKMKINNNKHRQVKNDTILTNMDNIKVARSKIEHLISEKMEILNIYVQRAFTININLQGVIHVGKQLLEKANSKKIDIEDLEKLIEDGKDNLVKCEGERNKLIEIRQSLPDLKRNPIVLVGVNELEIELNKFLKIKEKNVTDQIDIIYKNLEELSHKFDQFEKKNFLSLANLQQNNKEIKVIDVVDCMEYDMMLAKFRIGVIGNSGS